MNYNAALKEDIGSRDITTELIIPKDKLSKAVLIVKEPCVICGIKVAQEVFKTLDKKIKFVPKVSDGEDVKKGKVLAEISGYARPILAAERTALNYLSLLSGVATQTRKFTVAVKPYKVKIMDTRKTIPGLRGLQKYAVRIGGGCNHRMRLDEMILVKDNHLKVTKGYYRLPKVARGYKIEIEVKNLKEFREALRLRPDIIMLDNMSVKDMKKAVEYKDNLSAIRYPLSAKIEASGGVTLKNVRKIAATGVDMISVGALTHSVKSIDISLEIL